MVRVGGGWDTLQNYLDKHDPCRCRRGKNNFDLALRHNIQHLTFDQCLKPRIMYSLGCQIISPQGTAPLRKSRIVFNGCQPGRSHLY